MDPNEDLSDLPELEDLSQELSKLKPMPIHESEGDIGDYAKPKPEKPSPQEIVKPETQKPQPAFSGLKKGFFSQSSEQSKPKQAPIEEIKLDPQAKNSIFSLDFRIKFWNYCFFGFFIVNNLRK